MFIRASNLTTTVQLLVFSLQTDLSLSGLVLWSSKCLRARFDMLLSPMNMNKTQAYILVNCNKNNERKIVLMNSRMSSVPNMPPRVQAKKAPTYTNSSPSAPQESTHPNDQGTKRNPKSPSPRQHLHPSGLEVTSQAMKANTDTRLASPGHTSLT